MGTPCTWEIQFDFRIQHFLSLTTNTGSAKGCVKFFKSNWIFRVHIVQMCCCLKERKIWNFKYDLKMTSTPLCSTLSDHHHFLSQIMIAFEIKQISYQKLSPYLTNWQKNRANILVIKHRLILKSGAKNFFIQYHISFAIFLKVFIWFQIMSCLP